MKLRRRSRRFDRNNWARRLALPLVLMLAAGLLLTLAIVVLSILGLTPGS